MTLQAQPAQTPEPGDMKFTNQVEGFMDTITNHLVSQIQIHSLQ